MRRVLSVQSHVTHGYVGNKAATFPMQVLGIHVNPINTVNLSNRPDYVHKCKGHSLEAPQFKNILQGLFNNQLMDYNAVLSGYISSQDIIHVLFESLKEMKKAHPSLLYICDPVLGDNNKFYVNEALLDEYKTKLLPLARVITPNYFEAQMLSGVTITNFQSAVEACKALHRLGPDIIVLKGVPLEDYQGRDHLSLILSQQKGQDSNELSIYRRESMRLSGSFSGAGDLFTALITAYLVNHPSMNLGDVLDTVGATMHGVLSMTQAAGSKELKVIEAIDIYRSPKLTPFKRRSYLAYAKVTGVIFDLDGTLTMPGAIDFPTLMKRLDLPSLNGSAVDIVGTVNNIASEEIRNEKWAIIEDEESKAERRMELQPGVNGALDLLNKNRIRVSVATRNNINAVSAFLKLARLEPDQFSPIVSRHCLDGVNKPDPLVAQHIMERWGVLKPSQVWFVGDSGDDMRCGKSAGCLTCLLRNPSNVNLSKEMPELIDLEVGTLTEFVNFLNIEG